MIGTQSTAKIEVAIEPVSTGDAKELVIYHLVKEALTNAVMHSRASQISVEIGQDESGTRVSVTDDGIGFDPLVEHEGHYGIQIMRERTRSVGGQIYLDSKPGDGTRITAVFPSR